MKQMLITVKQYVSTCGQSITMKMFHYDEANVENNRHYDEANVDNKEANVNNMPQAL